MAGVRIWSAEQLSAVKLFGQRAVMREGVRVTEPALGSRAVRAMLIAGYERDDIAMLRILTDAGVNGPGIELFRRNKVVARLPHAEGGGLQVQPNIPGLADDDLSLYAGSTDGDYVDDAVLHRVPVVVDSRELTYKLNAVFTDVTTSDKLQISPRRLQAAKRHAVVDPAAAAASLSEYLKHNGFPNSRVVAGDYAKSISRSREIIRQFAATIVYKDLAVPAMANPKELRLLYDGMVPDGDPQWTTVGPLQYASEVQAIHQLAIHYGPDRTMFILGVETALLRINIYNEVTKEYYTGQMEGYSSLHGIRPSHSGLPAELTAEQHSRLAMAAHKVSPVYVDDMVVGTAVYVSDQHAILNEHTLVSVADADKVPVIGGLPVHESRSVSHDISMVKRGDRSAQWSFRHCDVGERVVLCYSVGEAVEYSEVLRVLAVNGEQLVLSESNVLRRGASGAAVIALRDSALLGIFSTRRGHNVVCAAFTSATFNMISDHMSVVSSDHAPTPADEAGDRTYQRMVRRGLQGFLEQIYAATATLYVEHDRQKHAVGLVANVSGVWTTTVDPNIAQLVMEDGKSLTFRSHRDGMYQAVSPPPVLTALPNVRLASPGERVFLFTRAGSDVVMSSVRVVTHCMSDAKRFIVEDFGSSDLVTTAALVVAERDAAVLGQYVVCDEDAFGVRTVVCTSFDLPVVVPGLQFVSTDTQSVVSELRDVVSRVNSTSTLGELAQFGKSLVDVVAGQRAYHAGMSIHDGTALINSEWRDKRHKVLAAFGWNDTDWDHFIGCEFADVAYAFVAVAYLQDSAGTAYMLGQVLVEDTVVETTPVVGEFPFPHASPVLDPFSTLRRSVSPASLGDSDVRLRQLETRISQLTKVVDSMDVADK